jgi:hypothetical protein
MTDDKKGLLGFIATPEGQGLLATVFGGLAGARRGQPLNSIGRAGMAGIMGYGNALDRDAQTGRNAQAQAFQKMQMDRWNKQGAIDDQISALAPKFFAPGTPGVPGGIPSDIGPMPPIPATPPRFDAQGYGSALMGIAPEKGAAWLQAMQKDDAPINVGPGVTVFDPRTNQPIFTAPFAPEKPKEPRAPDSKIEQFEYAKSRGYKGTFEQFVTLAPTIMAGASAPLRAAQVGNIEAENAYNLPPPRPTAASGGASVTTPDGRVFRFKDQAAANKFKFEAGIK